MINPEKSRDFIFQHPGIGIRVQSRDPGISRDPAGACSYIFPSTNNNHILAIRFLQINIFDIVVFINAFLVNKRSLFVPNFLGCIQDQAPAGSRDIPGSRDFFKIPIPGFSEI